MKLEFKKLKEIKPTEFIELFNDSRVVRQMPLANSSFGESEYNSWVTNKEEMWTVYGYGPWAFVIDGKFIGWGGLQPENGDADLALVIHPDYWGKGKIIYDKIIEVALTEFNLKSITILLPPSRKHIQAIFKLGFESDGELEIDGQKFNRFRLKLVH